MKPKYETLPSNEEANYFIFSVVGNTEEIKQTLERFPQRGDFTRPTKYVGKEQVFHCSSLAFSGTVGNNVPITPYVSRSFGLLINPNAVDIPFAHINLGKTHSVIPKMEIKREDTKYKNKPVTANYRHTNHATWQHNPEVNGRKSAKVIPNNGAEVFAGNVWRKYFKRGHSLTNECLCLQKDSEKHPVEGIFLYLNQDAYHAEIIEKNASLLTEILRNN